MADFEGPWMQKLLAMQRENCPWLKRSVAHFSSPRETQAQVNSGSIGHITNHQQLPNRSNSRTGKLRLCRDATIDTAGFVLEALPSISQVTGVVVQCLRASCTRPGLTAGVNRLVVLFGVVRMFWKMSTTGMKLQGAKQH